MPFFDRFAAAVSDPDPFGLQLLFHDPPALAVGSLAADALADVLRAQPELADVRVELASADIPPGAQPVSADGPPASAFGLFEWANHVVKLAQFDEPMPYGPVESCVGPAMMPPPLKVDAKQHRSHVLLFYAGTHPDPLERFVAVCAAAGAVARLGASVVMNEDARTAAPAADFIPDDGEDALATYRGLPIPYLLGGFVKMDAGDPARPWVRTFANRRLGLPELARHLTGHDRTADTFQLFAGLLGYLRTTGEAFTAGDVIDLGRPDGGKLRLREPHEHEWFLESSGPMLVIEETE